MQKFLPEPFNEGGPLCFRRSTISTPSSAKPRPALSNE